MKRVFIKTVIATVAMATMGIAAHAVLRTLLGYDATAFAGMRVKACDRKPGRGQAEIADQPGMGDADGLSQKGRGQRL